MNSTPKKSRWAKWCIGGMAAACLAGNALGATIRESYTLAPSGDKGSFVAHPGIVDAIVENGLRGQSVKLAVKAMPERGRHIVQMDVYVAKAVQRDTTFDYHQPLDIPGHPEKAGARVWALPEGADKAPVFDLSDQNIAAPTKVYVYVIEKDRNGRSHSTMVETRYAALHAGYVYNH